MRKIRAVALLALLMLFFGCAGKARAAEAPPPHWSFKRAALVISPGAAIYDQDSGVPARNIGFLPMLAVSYEWSKYLSFGVGAMYDARETTPSDAGFFEKGKGTAFGAVRMQTFGSDIGQRLHGYLGLDWRHHWGESYQYLPKQEAVAAVIHGSWSLVQNQDVASKDYGRTSLYGTLGFSYEVDNGEKQVRLAANWVPWGQ